MKEIIKVYSNNEESYTNEEYEFRVDGVAVGYASVMIDDSSAYVERIDIDEEQRNKGYGTEFLRGLSEKYGDVYVAPDNEDAQRLYDRIGFECYDDAYSYADQGYGVYRI